MRRPICTAVVLLLGACSGGPGAADGPADAKAMHADALGLEVAGTASTLPATTTSLAAEATSTPPIAEPATVATTTTTGATTTTEQPRERIVIHAVGDVGLSSMQHGAFLSEGYEIAWSGVDGLFRRDALTIVNLECDPSLLGAALEKAYAFRCDLEALPVMVEAGIEVAGMGNNHAGDYGKEALVDGRRNLEAAGLTAVGAGRDLEEANRPARFEIGGWRIAVVAFSWIGGGDAWFAGPNWPGVAPADHDNIRAAVGAASEGADIVIVSVHWGEEGATGPTAADIERARVMIEAGADVIVGHHSHQLQAMEYLEGRPVFWSLGDFVWPVLPWRSEETAVAEIVVGSDGTIEGRLIPAYIVSHGHPVLLGPPGANSVEIPVGSE